jgi:hypothetical protein
MQQTHLQSGPGWRLGYRPTAPHYQGLLGTDDWAVELTGAELQDFCRLLLQLVDTVTAAASELMPEERLTCELETERVWLEIDGLLAIDGLSLAYDLRLMLNGDRNVEAAWDSAAVLGLVGGVRSLMEQLPN